METTLSLNSPLFRHVQNFFVCYSDITNSNLPIHFWCELPIQRICWCWWCHSVWWQWSHRRLFWATWQHWTLHCGTRWVLILPNTWNVKVSWKVNKITKELAVFHDKRPWLTPLRALEVYYIFFHWYIVSSISAPIVVLG